MDPKQNCQQSNPSSWSNTFSHDKYRNIPSMRPGLNFNQEFCNYVQNRNLVGHHPTVHGNHSKQTMPNNLVNFDTVHRFSQSDKKKNTQMPGQMNFYNCPMWSQERPSLQTPVPSGRYYPESSQNTCAQKGLPNYDELHVSQGKNVMKNNYIHMQNVYNYYTLSPSQKYGALSPAGLTSSYGVDLSNGKRSYEEISEKASLPPTGCLSKAQPSNLQNKPELSKYQTDVTQASRWYRMPECSKQPSDMGSSSTNAFSDLDLIGNVHVDKSRASTDSSQYLNNSECIVSNTTILKDGGKEINPQLCNSLAQSSAISRSGNKDKVGMVEASRLNQSFSPYPASQYKSTDYYQDLNSPQWNGQLVSYCHNPVTQNDCCYVQSRMNRTPAYCDSGFLPSLQNCNLTNSYGRYSENCASNGKFVDANSNSTFTHQVINTKSNQYGQLSADKFPNISTSQTFNVPSPGTSQIPNTLSPAGGRHLEDYSNNPIDYTLDRTVQKTCINLFDQYIDKLILSSNVKALENPSNKRKPDEELDSIFSSLHVAKRVKRTEFSSNEGQQSSSVVPSSLHSKKRLMKEKYIPCSVDQSAVATNPDNQSVDYNTTEDTPITIINSFSLNSNEFDSSEQHGGLDVIATCDFELQPLQSQHTDNVEKDTSNPSLTKTQQTNSNIAKKPRGRNRSSQKDKMIIKLPSFSDRFGHIKKTATSNEQNDDSLDLPVLAKPRKRNPSRSDAFQKRNCELEEAETSRRTLCPNLASQQIQNEHTGEKDINKGFLNDSMPCTYSDDSGKEIIPRVDMLPLDNHNKTDTSYVIDSKIINGSHKQVSEATDNKNQEDSVQFKIQKDNDVQTCVQQYNDPPRSSISGLKIEQNNSSPESHTVLSPVRETEQYGTRVTNCSDDLNLLKSDANTDTRDNDSAVTSKPVKRADNESCPEITGFDISGQTNMSSEMNSNFLISVNEQSIDISDIKCQSTNESSKSNKYDDLRNHPLLSSKEAISVVSESSKLMEKQAEILLLKSPSESSAQKESGWMTSEIEASSNKGTQQESVPISSNENDPLKLEVVDFHGDALLSISNKMCKYVIFIELLKVSFRQIEKKRVFTASKRDLKIPFKQLSVNASPQLHNYLVNKCLLGRKKKNNVYVITFEDASRLFHFFFGMKHCKSGCVSAENTVNVSNVLSNKVNSDDVPVDGQSKSEQLLSDSCRKKSGLNPAVTSKTISDAGMKCVRKSWKQSTVADVLKGGSTEFNKYMLRFLLVNNIKHFLLDDIQKVFSERLINCVLHPSVDLLHVCDEKMVIFLSKLEPKLPAPKQGMSMVVPEEIFKNIVLLSQVVKEVFHSYKTKQEHTFQEEAKDITNRSVNVSVDSEQNKQFNPISVTMADSSHRISRGDRDRIKKFEPPIKSQPEVEDHFSDMSNVNAKLVPDHDCIEASVSLDQVKETNISLNVSDSSKKDNQSVKHVTPTKPELHSEDTVIEIMDMETESFKDGNMNDFPDSDCIEDKITCQGKGTNLFSVSQDLEKDSLFETSTKSYLEEKDTFGAVKDVKMDIIETGNTKISSDSGCTEERRSLHKTRDIDCIEDKITYLVEETNLFSVYQDLKKDSPFEMSETPSKSHLEEKDTFDAVKDVKIDIIEKYYTKSNSDSGCTEERMSLDKTRETSIQSENVSGNTQCKGGEPSTESEAKEKGNTSDIQDVKMDIVKIENMETIFDNDSFEERGMSADCLTVIYLDDDDDDDDDDADDDDDDGDDKIVGLNADSHFCTTVVEEMVDESLRRSPENSGSAEYFLKLKEEHHPESKQAVLFQDEGFENLDGKCEDSLSSNPTVISTDFPTEVTEDLEPSEDVRDENFFIAQSFSGSCSMTTYAPENNTDQLYRKDARNSECDDSDSVKNGMFSPTTLIDRSKQSSDYQSLNKEYLEIVENNSSDPCDVSKFSSILSTYPHQIDSSHSSSSSSPPLEFLYVCLIENEDSSDSW